MTHAKRDFRIAVVSDTHGLLRPQVEELVRDADHILHAGDVGDIAILKRLSHFAPITAIRGNIDTAGACALLPPTELVEVGGITIYMVHSLADLDVSPVAAGVRLVVSGHSHKPDLIERQGVTYLNPGSVGPRRFKLPVSMAFVQVQDGALTVEQVNLPIEAK